jgi:hypothetical protein
MEFDSLFWWFWSLVYPLPLTFQRLSYCSMKYLWLSGHPVLIIQRPYPISMCS